MFAHLEFPTLGKGQGLKAGFGYIVSGWAPWATQDPLSSKEKQIRMLLSGGVAHSCYPSPWENETGLEFEVTFADSWGKFKA